MENSKRQKTAQAIATLIPHVVQGAQLGVLADRSITQTQFLLLVYLYARGPSTMSGIASHMQVQLPTVTGVVDRLVQSKYIVRTADPDDRRKIVVELTPHALKFLKQFQGVIANRWEEVLSILDDKELGQMQSIITKLNSAMLGQKP